MQAFLENEQKTVDLVKDVADVLENVAANPLHTPALYSGFLRALIFAKVDPSAPLTNGETASMVKGDGDETLTTSIQGGTPNSFNGFINGNGGEVPSIQNEFQFESEMGPVADMSTFPPTMAANPSEDNMGMLTMDSILSSGFWDSVLVPGKHHRLHANLPQTCHSWSRAGYSNSMEGLSGGFVFGAGGSGLITPRIGLSPMHSGSNTPARNGQSSTEFTQQTINAAFENPSTAGIAINADA